MTRYTFPGRPTQALARSRYIAVSHSFALFPPDIKISPGFNEYTHVA
jgi:hypothetical protein